MSDSELKQKIRSGIMVIFARRLSSNNQDPRFDITQASLLDELHRKELRPYSDYGLETIPNVWQHALNPYVIAPEQDDLAKTVVTEMASEGLIHLAPNRGRGGKSTKITLTEKGKTEARQTKLPDTIEGFKVVGTVYAARTPPISAPQTAVGSAIAQNQASQELADQFTNTQDKSR